MLDLIEAHRSTIVFANSRRLAERLCGRLNELATERAWAGRRRPGGGAAAARRARRRVLPERGRRDLGHGRDRGRGGPGPALGRRRGPGRVGPDGTVVIARAHHGSVSRVERSEIEEALKAGRLPAVVATSSLELGIDMGAVDLVIQVESPPSVASGLQRVGRAGHNVGDVSRGVIFPKYAGDLIQASVVAERMQERAIEELRIPRNPLDVLAQQIVAMAALDDWAVDELEAVVRRAAPFSGLTRPVLEAVLDMLAGRYPGEEFAGLKPRVVWDRVAGVIHGRPGAQRLAVTSGGTIPDRGYFGVFLASGDVSGRGVADEAGGTITVRGAGARQPKRVGELDEEMVYESRVGDVFVLGASSWRIEDITPDRVLVLPAPGQPGKLPFWHGDTPGRPAELGKAIGAKVRELAALPEDKAVASLRAGGLDELAARNLVRYLAEQRQATGHVPDDRTLVVERFRDELGDWRVVLHSPYGDRVHAPWALAISARLRERYGGMDVQALHTDDGIIIRVPDSDEPPPAGVALLDPDEIGEIITAEVGGSALFASRFRECAARALLLPRRQPGRRTPLWQQRQRSAQLLEIAAQFPGFPITLETVRECLQDVFDVPALTEVLRDLAARRIQLVEVETATPSPFGRSLLFRYVGAFMYEGDAPLAERRAQALALDPTLLAELLGTEAMRELLDPAVVAETEADLQHLSAGRRGRDAEAVADLLRTSGPLTDEEVAARCVTPESAGDWLAGLASARRVIEVRVAGQQMWAAIEDAGRLRDALGVALPVGIPEAFTEPLPDPLGDLVARWARTHGPFTAADVASRYGLGVAVVAMALRRLGGRRAGRGGRVPHHPARHPVVRQRGPADAATAQPGPAAQGGGAGPGGRARPVPARLARDPGVGRDGGRPRARRRCGRRGRPGGRGWRRRPDAGAVLEAIERLAGAPVPAAALETLVLPGRVPGLLPGAARRAQLGGRGGLGRGRDGRHRGRLAGARARRVGAAAAARAGRADHDAAARGGADRARGRRRPVLPHARRPGGPGARRPPARRRRSGGGGVGPRLGGVADQRHAGAAAGADVRRRGRTAARRRPGGRPRWSSARPGGPRGRRGGGAGRVQPPARPGPDGRLRRRVWRRLRRPDPAARDAVADRPAHRQRPLVAAARPARRPRGRRHRPRRRWCRGTRRGRRTGGGDHARARARADPARTARRAHQGRRRGRAGAGRVRRRLPGAAGDGGDRPVPPGLLRRGPRGGPVRAAGRGRPDARDGGRPGRGRLRGASGGRPRHPAAAADSDRRGRTVVLAAADPAQPYGAALPWPSRPEETATSHRPGRKAGAVVVLFAGELALYVERGGKTLLSWTDDPAVLAPCAHALAAAVRDGALGRITVEKADGGAVYDSPLAAALSAAGFRATPRGLRLRG